MNHEEAKEMKKSLNDYVKRMSASKESALQALVAAGIMNKKGKLATPYKG
ncbi:MAG: hypothetical protein Alis2KO_42090 [Aliiglaciecola sp.]